MDICLGVTTMGFPAQFPIIQFWEIIRSPPVLASSFSLLDDLVVKLLSKAIGQPEDV